MKTQKTKKTALELLNESEENIAYNLCWLNDQFDLEIRQGNKEVLERLAMIDQAWKNIVHAIPAFEDLRKESKVTLATLPHMGGNERSTYYLTKSLTDCLKKI